jgi:hypothetical protein
MTCTAEELHGLLKLLDTDDPARIEPLLFALADKIPKQAYTDMVAAVGNFDFHAAITIATDLLAELPNED